MNNGRPLPVRKQMQFLVAMTLLAWATQTLMTQWSHGAEPPGPAPQATSAFVPREGSTGAGAMLELRGEATIYGGDVKLKQVCRWSTRDAATFAPLADLVVARLEGRRPFKVLDVGAIKQTLADAGVNVALVRFSGPVECTVSRNDVQLDEGEALEQWIQAHGGGGADADAEPANNAADAAKVPHAAEAEPQPAALRQPPKAKISAAVKQFADVPPADEADDDSGVRTLRAALLDDLSVRLGLAAEDLQVAFDPRDEPALNLAEPAFKFNLDARRVRDLGEVAWDVTVVTDTGSRKVPVRATARAWQRQLIATKPLARGQVIQASDVTARRALVDRLPDGAALAAEQVLGQVAARGIKAGTLITGPLVEAVPLAKVGQFITITLNRGTVRIKSVGKALDPGSYGQTIRVKNEATRDVYQVVLTGPQEATMAAPNAAPDPAPHAGVASLGQN